MITSSAVSEALETQQKTSISTQKNLRHKPTENPQYHSPKLTCVCKTSKTWKLAKKTVVCLRKFTNLSKTDVPLETLEFGSRACATRNLRPMPPFNRTKKLFKHGETVSEFARQKQALKSDFQEAAKRKRSESCEPNFRLWEEKTSYANWFQGLQGQKSLAHLYGSCRALPAALRKISLGNFPVWDCKAGHLKRSSSKATAGNSENMLQELVATK